MILALPENPANIAVLSAIKQADEQGGGHINTGRPIVTNLHCRTLIEEVRQHNYDYPASEIYLRKKAQLLLQSFIHDFSGLSPTPDVRLNANDVMEVDELKAYLKANLNKPLSQEHLYKVLQVEDPELLLMQFRKLHDITALKFHEHYSMEQMFEAIVNSDVAVRKIAVWFGYESLNAFRRAFMEFFAIDPFLLRKGE